ncbi:hypothetical protein GTQ40_12775 [Flavobacteriaceae bacterium R38]|nr:hypothetical protein [Flavobacteriaceae bacterium R38]
MTSIKLLLPLSRIIIFGIWFLFYFFWKIHWFTILIPIILDLCIKFYVYDQIKKKQREKSLIFIMHQRFKSSLGIKVVKVIILIVLILVIINTLFVNNTHSIGIILSAYIIISSFIFFNDFDGYLMDKNGIVQFELFENNYQWQEIEEVIVNPNEIRLKIKSKQYVTRIREDNSRTVAKFLDEIEINYNA